MFASAASFFCFIFPALQAFLTPTCHRPRAAAPPKRMPSSRRTVIGTFFGRKRGRVSFAVQTDPWSEPVLLLELATTMHQLAKEMESGKGRILLECDRDANANTTASKKKRRSSSRRSLWEEPVWDMYCNGHQRGYAVSRQCNETDLHVLKTVQAVSVGAGVLPPPPIAPPFLPPHPLEMGRCSNNDDNGGGDSGGASGEVSDEMIYMRAEFERVVGSVDLESFYMISPDDYGHGGPEISVFLLRK